MTIADHGGFDILVDGTAALVNRVLGGRIPPISVSRAVSTPEASGTATIHLATSSVRFEAGEIIVVQLSLAGSRFDVTSAAGYPEIPPALQAVTIGGTVEMRDTLDARGLDVVLDTAANAARSTPGVTVTLDRAAFLASPLVELILARAALLGGEAEAQRVRELLVSTVTTLLETELRAALTAAAIRQILFSFPRNIAPGTGVPDTVPPIVLSSPTGSLRIGATLGGTPGNAARISRSNLASGDALAFIVSNACLLRDLVRPNLDRRFMLSANGTFLPGDPFAWSGRAPIPIPGVGTVFITSLSVFADELGRLTLLISLSASFVEGAISVSATLRVPVSLSVTSSAAGLNATLTPGRATVLSSRVDVAAWVYVAVFFGGGPLLLAALAVADAFADGAVSGPIEVAVNGAISAVSFVIPLPAGVPALRFTSLSLFQADAPRRTITVAGVSMPAPGRDHDLIVRLA